MRLLSDKMQDKKSFVHSLARAVSRSSVILIAGPLFGEEGSIKTVADAINTTTEIADNTAFGISSDDQIEIIKDSVPLVTADGYFGGCIIESGPQTMILLTDNKNIRKTIMKNLIHPYIEELYSAETANIQEQTQDEETINNEIIIDAQPEEIIELEITEEAIPEETDSIETIIMDDDYTTDSQEIIDQEDDEDIVDLYFEPTKLNRKTLQRYSKRYIADSEDYDDQDDYYNQKKTAKNSLALCVFIISIILLLVVAVLCYCIFLVPAKQGTAPVAYLQDIFNTMFG